MPAAFNPGIVYMTASSLPPQAPHSLHITAQLTRPRPASSSLPLPCKSPIAASLPHHANISSVLHFHSLHLSLPISSAVTVLTVVLPVAAFINAFVYPNLLRNSATAAADRDWWQRAGPVVLQGLQAVFTTALATVLAEGFVPSAALDCVLAGEWEDLYAARDGESIRFVQDTLRCCGYAGVDDRAFPFVEAGGSNETCAEVYGRERSCKAPWRAAMETHSGIAFGVVIAVGLMQVC